MSQVIDSDSNSIQTPLKVVDESTGSESPVSLVTVILETKRVQPPVPGGISFWLTVTNGSKHALKVQSPLEGLGISLLDGKGWPVRLPPGTPPRALINYDGPFKVIRPYRVIEIKEAGSGKDLLSTVDELNWTLPAEGAVRVGITIDHIIPGGSPDPPLDTTPVSLPEGSYKLKLIVVLISALGAGHRVFNSDYVSVKIGER